MLQRTEAAACEYITTHLLSQRATDVFSGVDKMATSLATVSAVVAVMHAGDVS